MPQISFKPAQPEDTRESILDKRVKNDRRAVLAAMETGNHEAARTVVRELADVDVKRAGDLRSDVLGAYGVAL